MRIALAWTLRLSVLALCAQVLMVAPAAAQEFPQGSYLQSCAQIHWSGSTLVAECQRRDGRYTGTGLANARSCAGDISNDNGQLRCQYGGQRGYGSPGPEYGRPGYGGYGGYGDRRERCEELRHRRHELRERIESTPWGPEREHLEHRLHEIREARERLGCD